MFHTVVVNLWNGICLIPCACMLDTENHIILVVDNKLRTLKHWPVLCEQLNSEPDDRIGHHHSVDKLHDVSVCLVSLELPHNLIMRRAKRSVQGSSVSWIFWEPHPVFNACSETYHTGWDCICVCASVCVYVCVYMGVKERNVSE